MEFWYFLTIFVLFYWIFVCDCLPTKKLIESIFSSKKSQYFPRFVDAENFPIFCQPWKTVEISMDFDGKNFVEVGMQIFETR